MVRFSNTDDAKCSNENAPALDFAWMRIGLALDFPVLGRLPGFLADLDLMKFLAIGISLPNSSHAEFLAFNHGGERIQ